MEEVMVAWSPRDQGGILPVVAAIAVWLLPWDMETTRQEHPVPIVTAE